MRNKIFKGIISVSLIFIAFTLLSFFKTESANNTKYTFPYKKAGLTKEQAAEHLLSRFTFGVQQKDIEQVSKMGLENWFEKQLDGNESDNEMQSRLNDYDALSMTNSQILATFPRANVVKNMAEKEGVISKEDLKSEDKKEYVKLLNDYKQKKGFKDEKELFRQFLNQKIIRATYSNNQLHEILTDFWFNHFNVSITKNDCAQFIPVYERDAIRPNVTGKFEDLLLATAKSPAMLIYLDNFVSTGSNEELDALMEKRRERLEKKGDTLNIPKKRNNKGLNENYAREVMELHTMGVDGGYTQQDVTEAARVLTGWTVYPIADYGAFGQVRKVIERIGEENLIKNGFVHEGDFLFAMNRHDTKDKKVLGQTYTNTGYQEGVTLLKNLAQQNATAAFICKKIATRFVNDNPPKSLIEKMAKTFMETNGDIKSVLITMASATEFWSKEALRQKTKSPFEYAISSLRGLNADVKMPIQINNWITKMGQKMYFYQAPTGYPDKAQYWINTGSLLNRMNFGLALASKRIPGVQFDLAALNNNHEPESAEDALTKYASIIIPQRNLEETIKRLKPLVNDQSISTKINDAVSKTKSNEEMMMEEENTMEGKTKKEKTNLKKMEAVQLSFGDNSMLAQVVGIIIGSPEFQRK